MVTKMCKKKDVHYEMTELYTINSYKTRLSKKMLQYVYNLYRNQLVIWGPYH